MGKMLKKIMSITLIVSMILGSAYTFEAEKKTVYASENVSDNATDYVQVGSDLTVSSDTSMGKLIADKLSQTGSEQQSNNGYNVLSVTVQGKIAEAEFECAGDAQLVVAIYSEDGTQLKGIGKTDIEKSDEKVKINIDIDTMPEYFLIKAFIIDNTMSPLCQIYESSMYTKEMQELLEKTTDDFDKDKVLNLDSDKTNNFAVYKDDVTRLSSGSSNTLVSYDAENGVYTFSNVNSTITQLKADDIFAYDNNGTEIIIKVDRISVNGTNAVIYGKDTSLEEVFDYVKVDGSQDVGEGKFDTTNMQTGVQYNGMSDYTGGADTQSEEADYPEAVKAIGVNAEGSYEKEADFKFTKTPVKCDDNNYAEINGEIKLAAKAGIKVYVTVSYQYVEVKLDTSAYLMLSLQEKLGGDIKLGELTFSPCPGVNVGFEIKIVIKADVNLKVSGKLECTVGFSYGSTEGFRNISTTPKFTSKIEVTGQIYLGLSLETKITVISENIAKAWMKGEAGAVIEAKADFDRGKEGEYTHDCLVCIDGEIYGKINVSAGIKFFNNDDLSLKKDIVKIEKIPIADFYFSCTYGDGGWGKCPHYKYRVNFVVVNNVDDNMHDTQIVIDGKDKYTLSRKNNISIYVSNGEHEVVYSKYGYNDTKKKLKINGSTDKQYVRLTNVSGSNKNKVVDVQIEGDYSRGVHTAAITENGELYMWGYNEYGQVGDGTTEDRYVPKKIMENVLSVSLSGHNSAAITENGDLYTWGYNIAGQIGDGTTENRYLPQKIMENVVYVSLGNCVSAAITEKGELYTWGVNTVGGIGDGTTTNRYTPTKIMENVIYVKMLYGNAMAITEDGKLYVWGNNLWGQLGDGTNNNISVPKVIMENVAYANLYAVLTKDKSLYTWEYDKVGIPQKIMENVTCVNSSNQHVTALTEDGELYRWLENSSGQVGDGTTVYKNKPQKIMNNISSISTVNNASAAITQNGELYMWGNNDYGNLGNGTTKKSTSPQKIMNNVSVVKLYTWVSAAITKNGELYMWGNNKYGCLANKTETRIYVPKKVNIGKNTSGSSVLAATDNSQYVNVKSTAAIQSGKVTKYLVPDSEYMMYVVKSVDDKADFLSSDNIVYIDQITTDNTGKMEYEYNPLWENAHVVIIGRDNKVEYDNNSGYIIGIKDGVSLTALNDMIHKRYKYISNTNASDNQYIKTGDIIKLYGSKGNNTYSYTICIKGDIDGNGSIDVLDMEAIQKSILGIGDKLSGVYKEAASLTGSTDISVLDMEAIQKDILGIQKIN